MPQWTWLIPRSFPVLPQFRNEHLQSAVPPDEVTKVCLRLRHLIQECIPCEMELSRITTPHSRIITPKVVKAAKDAGSQRVQRLCGVLRCWSTSQWFRHEALTELWDSGLHKLRAEACGAIAKSM